MKRRDLVSFCALLACLALAKGCGSSGDGPTSPGPGGGGGPPGWFEQTRPTTLNLVGVAAIDEDNVVVVGQAGFIARRTRGGRWQIQTSGTTEILRDVAFSGSSTGVAVGENGTIVRTTNGGGTWQTVTSGTAETLNAVALGNAGAGVIVGDNGTVLNSSNGGASWTSRMQDPVMSFQDVRFVTADSIFAAGSTANDSTDILLSTDGGDTWTEMCCGSTYSSVAAIGQYHLGALRLIDLWGSGDIMQSNDGGQTWFQSTGVTGVNDAELFGVRDAVWTISFPSRIQYGDYGFPVSAPTDVQGTLSLQAMDFADTTTGWVVGARGLVLRTDDKGRTWQNEYETGAQHNQRVFFLDANNGWVGASNSEIYRTTDAGGTWTRQTAGSGSAWISGLWFLDGNHGFAASYVSNETFFETTNGGQTWSFVSSVPNRGYADVMFVDNMTGYACGSDVIIKTVDGGTNWSVLDDGRSDFPTYVAIFFADADHGFASENNTPTFMRTTDGGASWDSLGTTGDATRWWSMYFRNATEGWLAGAANNSSNGVILYTDDAGTSWTEQYRTPVTTIYQLYGIHFADDMNGWAVGGNFRDIIVHTTDGGATWTEQEQVTADFNRRAFRDVWAIDTRTAVAVGDWNVIMRTETAGESP